MSVARNQTIDVAKGIGILLVIFAHVNISEPCLTILYSFHMPLFFFLSGMVFRPEKYPSLKKLYGRKLQTMICPYVLFCVLGALRAGSIELALSVLRKSGSFLPFLKQCLYSIIWAPYSQKYFVYFNTPMWFVPCLLLVETMYYLLAKAGKRRIFVPICVSVITVFGWIMEADIIPFDFSVLPWNFSSACFSLGFFAAGNYFSRFVKMVTEREREREAFRKNRILKLTVLLALMLAVLIPLALRNGKVSIGSRILHNGFLFYITGILGTGCMLALASLLKQSRFLQFCGRNSFTIMGSHFVIFGLVNSFLGVARHLHLPIELSPRSFPQGTILFVIVASLSLLFVLFYNKIKEKILQRSLKNGRTA